MPARFERQVHVQETLACRCGEELVTAEGPRRVVDKCQYGPGLLAHVVTAKCADSIPLYRQAKALARAGIPINRTTLGDLFHTAADVLAPLPARILQLVREAHLVRADETPIRVLAEEKTRRGYIWTFRTQKRIAYEYSASRSGETPARVLEGTKGYLLVDAYSGYNAVTLPQGRIRVGCWAHVRRKFFDALGTAPEAQGILDLILSLYRVEHAARDAGVLGQPKHLRLRAEQNVPLLGRIRDWLATQAPLHPPKSPLGEAIRYARGQWEALGRFVEDASLPLDNNASENGLRAARSAERISSPSATTRPERDSLVSTRSCDLPRQRSQPGGVPRGRPAPRADPPSRADRRTAPGPLGAFGAEHLLTAQLGRRIQGRLVTSWLRSRSGRCFDSSVCLAMDPCWVVPDRVDAEP